jgi:hypothetical protein
MPESSELYSEIANLRDQVEDMSKSISAIARRSGAKEEILKAMANDPLLGRIFLLVDGKRTQNDIVEELRGTSTAVSQPTVSRKIESLIEDFDLVRKTSRTREGTRYLHTSLARDLRIARALESKVAKSPGRATKKGVS